MRKQILLVKSHFKPLQSVGQIVGITMQQQGTPMQINGLKKNATGSPISLFFECYAENILAN